jgi:hypothetical protein
MRRVGLLAVGYLALGCARDPGTRDPTVRAVAARARAYLDTAALRPRNVGPSASAIQNPGSVLFADAGTFHKCHAGFSASGDAALDVMRLGLLCGPVNGMKLLLDVAATPAGATDEHSVPVRAGDCLRVMAAVRRGVQHLTVEVIGSEQRVLARGHGSSWLILDSEYPFCSSEAASFRVLVTLSGSADAGAPRAGPEGAAYALQIWRFRL